ncbi:GAF domain-containing protein [Candidatus Chloroploca sp. M-50]|uniref:histidine kinase n=1 Tax=Candidatus Chloroploca mongolica TaxID=2528176 RepID=A0ABS4D7P6_9CHLR|nr:GAF domain-containing protein [Candidatus Chloroploca mongolica]MBP1465467.1 GAF domain-containing protein [Candidatus Chloroploca mongolica]
MSHVKPGYNTLDAMMTPLTPSLEDGWSEERTDEGQWDDAQARFLAAAGVVLTSSLDYEQVLSRIAHLAVPLLADWCAVALAEPSAVPRRLALVCASPDQQALADTISCYQLPANAPWLFPRVISTGQPELIEDFSTHFFGQHTFDDDYLELIRQLKPCASFTVPLNVRGQTRGAITFTMAESRRKFTPALQALATELTRRAAVVVDNAILYRDTQRRLAELGTIQRVAQAITTSVRLDQICETVVNQISQVFGYTFVSIYLREGEELHLQTWIGYEHVLPVIRLNEGVIGRTVRDGKAYFVRDASTDPDFLHAVPGITQGIFVPIRYGHQPVAGIISIESSGEPALSDDDLKLLTLLADQISVALVNARLFARVEDAALRFRSLVETAGSVIVCLDPVLRVTEFNREAERVFGMAREAALGRDYLRTFVAPADRVAFVELARTTTTGAQPFSLETTIALDNDSERTFFWSLTWRQDVRGKPIELLVVGQDITARRHAEEARLAVERKMFEAQRLESLGVMAGGIAHDFNNLLAAILGNASLLLLDLPQESELYQSAREIELVTRRAADLVGQMLAYAGRGHFDVQPLDLNAVVAEMIGLLRISVNKKALLHQELTPDLPLIAADAAQIRQVVMNLIVNAAESLAEIGGTVTISTFLRELTLVDLATFHTFPEVTAGTYVCLMVTDTGIGMESASLSRIFDPFFTTKFAGRGLGLAAVMGIVRGHRGALTVKSTPGKGSSFTILLPVDQAGTTFLKTLSRPSGPSKPPTPPPDRPLILVIDDERDVRSIVIRILERGGYRTLSANDGIQGLAICDHLPQPLGAVLLDLTMPQMSGKEVFYQLRQRWPTLPVVLMSGYTTEEMTSHFHDDSPIAFLQKPFTAERLLNLLHQVLQPTE